MTPEEARRAVCAAAGLHSGGHPYGDDWRGFRSCGGRALDRLALVSTMSARPPRGPCTGEHARWAAGIEQIVDESLISVIGGCGTAWSQAVDARLLALVGGDSIDDADVLRCGRPARLGADVMAPSTLGTFLRSFTFGHVRQLEPGFERSSASLGGWGGAGSVPLTSTSTSTIVEVAGRRKISSGSAPLRLHEAAPPYLSHAPGDFDDRRVEVDRERHRTRPHPSRPGSADDRLERPVELTHMAERERAQKRAQRRGRHTCCPKTRPVSRNGAHRRRRSVATDERREDERQQLATRPCRSRRITEIKRPHPRSARYQPPASVLARTRPALGAARSSSKTSARPVQSHAATPIGTPRSRHHTDDLLSAGPAAAHTARLAAQRSFSAAPRTQHARKKRGSRLREPAPAEPARPPGSRRESAVKTAAPAEPARPQGRRAESALERPHWQSHTASGSAPPSRAP